MVLNIDGGNRVSYTYDEMDDTGEVTSMNKKKNFFSVDPDLESHIEAIQNYIRKNKLSN